MKTNHRRPRRQLGLSGKGVRLASSEKDLGSIPFRLSSLFKTVVVCRHCLVTLSFTLNETLKRLLPHLNAGVILVVTV